ncbi:hypothetical protein [Rhizobacter sp. P5_C2]|jgi:hypothetical protein
MSDEVKPSETASYLQGEVICAMAMIAALVKLLPDKDAFRREAVAELDLLRDAFTENPNAGPQLKAVGMTRLWLIDLMQSFPVDKPH